ncbi:MAG TPA: TetR/AcrR family transcriptional regulator [Deltaproteobacteria bacterium]|jgi:AcrR family transcriptional regulator|nr:TetR/AcrR family transcriptional regulator [Deltaproteobacteria bacterium]HOI07504.1 TetR/AcrR family transcriptional regulator [Deltaproteobacteria bacterium]
MKSKPVHQRTYGGVEADLRETERRKRLLAAGLEAFGSRGYAKTNIKTICSLAGLTERYFYESFGSKEDLLSAVYQELVDSLKADALKAFEENQGRPVEAATASLRLYLESFQQDPRKAQVQLFEVLGVSPKIDRQYQDAMRLLADMTKLFLSSAFPGIPEGAWKGSIVPTGLAGSIILISHEWVLNGCLTPLDNIMDQCMDLFMAVGRHLESRSRP